MSLALPCAGGCLLTRATPTWRVTYTAHVSDGVIAIIAACSDDTCISGQCLHEVLAMAAFGARHPTPVDAALLLVHDNSFTRGMVTALLSQERTLTSFPSTLTASR